MQGVYKLIIKSINNNTKAASIASLFDCNEDVEEVFVNDSNAGNSSAPVVPDWNAERTANNNLPSTVRFLTKSPATGKPNYHPNMKDPRVLERCQSAIPEIIVLYHNGPSRHCRELIDGALGHQSNKLSKWLRNVLLITTNDFYSKDAKLCKEHDLNQDGLMYISKLINGEVTDTWDVYKLKLSKERKLSLDLKFSWINENNESEELNKLKKPLVLEYLEKEFGPALREGGMIYKELSNRYWNRLQSVRGELRDSFLAANGFIYEYDIECCNVTLIMQYAEKCLRKFKKNNPNKKSPILRNGAILEYMHEKDDIRRQISEEVGVTVKQTKDVITALLNGASLRNPRGGLVREIGHHLARSYQKIDFIQRFVDNIKSCWECIVLVDDRRNILWKRGRNGAPAYLSKMKLKSSQRAGIYFELEKTVVNAVRAYIKKTGYGVFYIHDGWVTTNMLDTHELKINIYETTGYHVDIKLNILST